ncbi:hypothetical protein RLO149_p830450 (plasmid) [Roseobacter litoralis Och 149]|uniref:Uncharacterized protein n=1 Tax=Roseobacter litoralis (strain ATCC 49566 / DSM 6996 / JCM 21268 / NBRC 15278 / OCh 149) TaxID=391595 RepID=F7ZMD9_ROSLO|nr:hypothetical protein RLO149_p830450 [Roseobacter litoralis Och 149]
MIQSFSPASIAATSEERYFTRMVWNAFSFLRSACLAFVCLTITVVGTQAMPFEGEMSSAECGPQIPAVASAGEVPNHVHAHHPENNGERQADAHAGHGDGCHNGLCCVMDYQQHLDHRSEETAFTAPTRVGFFRAHVSREPLVPDRPPRHS